MATTLVTQPSTNGGGAGPTAPPGGSGGSRASATATASLGQVQVDGTSVSVPVSCAGDAGESCKVSLALSVTETLRHGKVIAVAAAQAHKVARTTTRVVVLASVTVTLTGGQSKTVSLTLDSAGKRQLAGHHTLSGRLTLAQAGKTVASRTITFKARRPAVKTR
jgi:hypothetical protein